MEIWNSFPSHKNNGMSKSPFWESVSRLAGQELTAVYGTLKFISHFTTSRHPEPHECSPHLGTVNCNTFSCLFHVKIVLRDQFPSHFPTNTLLAYKFLMYCKHSSFNSHLALLEFRLFYNIEKNPRILNLSSWYVACYRNPIFDTLAGLVVYFGTLLVFRRVRKIAKSDY